MFWVALGIVLGIGLFCAEFMLAFILGCVALDEFKLFEFGCGDCGLALIIVFVLCVYSLVFCTFVIVL